MVAIVRRTRELHALLKVRLGAGAAVLSPEVTRIHMEIGMSQFAGNAGAKQFWKRYLPRLKYHNPSVPMTVSRTEDSPCQMTIHFSSPTPSAAPETSTPQTKIVPLLLRTRSDILADVLKLTEAKEIEPTAAEAREVQALNEELFAINELRKKNQIIWAEMQREKEMMKLALGTTGDAPKSGRRRKAE